MQSLLSLWVCDKLHTEEPLCKSHCADARQMPSMNECTVHLSIRTLLLNRYGTWKLGTNYCTLPAMMILSKDNLM